MLRRLGLLFAALAFFSIAGGQWAVLQTVAWAEMLRDYTQRTGSVAVAIQQTFDGEHPCALCLQIAAAKQQQQAKADASKTAKTSPLQQRLAKAEKQAKALPLNGASSVYIDAPVAMNGFASLSMHAISGDHQPPTPPPRNALA